MGVSTDGIIAFGFPLDGEDDERPLFLVRSDGDDEEDEDIDFEEIQCSDLGIDLSEDYASKKEKLKQHPAELVYHCSGNYPMYFLAVNGTYVSASRGYPEKLSIPTVSEAQIAALKEWCVKHNVEWKEPGWYLMSYYC